MKKDAKRCVIMCMLAAVLLIIYTASLLYPVYAASLYTSHVTWDFGNVRGGTTPEHIFDLDNMYPWPVVVKTLTRGCGCTTASIDHRLPARLMPLGKLRVKVSLNTSLSYGPVDRYVKVQTNQSHAHDLILHIKCNIL
jgi:hypothetical protein